MVPLGTRLVIDKVGPLHAVRSQATSVADTDPGEPMRHAQEDSGRMAARSRKGFEKVPVGS